MKPMKQKNKSALAFILLTIPLHVFALEGDNSKPLHIVADSVELNQKTGINIYRGNVKADQGTTHLTADLVHTYSNKEHDITKMVATGNLAHFNTQPELKRSQLYTKAKTIEYYPQRKLAILIGDAHAKQDNNTFQGPLLEYNMQSQVISSKPFPNGRTTIVINNQSTATS